MLGIGFKNIMMDDWIAPTNQSKKLISYRHFDVFQCSFD